MRFNALTAASRHPFSECALWAYRPWPAVL